MFQRFTNEDHLAVHKHKHEMTLKFGPARTDSVIIAGLLCNNPSPLLCCSISTLNIQMKMLWRHCVPTHFQSIKSSAEDTCTGSIFNWKCECSVKKIWIVISIYSLLPDQTPTPTRFLKNCEEVGLFNELANSFEQDEDDKKSKNAVRVFSGYILCTKIIVNFPHRSRT